MQTSFALLPSSSASAQQFSFCPAVQLLPSSSASAQQFSFSPAVQLLPSSTISASICLADQFVILQWSRPTQLRQINFIQT
jgi:hypothetical protein